MSLGKKEFIVADLIRKELLIGELSIEENDFLQQWLSVVENQEYYQKIINLETLKSKEAFYKGINTDIAFQRIRENIKEDNIPVITLFKYRQLLKYAAVFLVLLGLATTFYYRKNSENHKQEVVNIIGPKYNNPTLVLADGTVVLLEPKKEKIVSKNGVISNINKVLVYDLKDLKDRTSTGDNTLIVPVGCIYAVNLSDGTKVWLNSKSSLRYPVAFSGDKRSVVLDGEAYFEVAKNKSKPFIVKSGNQNIQVLGTHFNVHAYSDEPVIKTTLLEGSVLVTYKNQKVILKPGEQSDADNNLNTVGIRTVDTEVAVAWKNGRFKFDNADLKTIMKQLERWYGIKVEYRGAVSDVRFNGGIFMNRNLSEVLEILEYNKIKFKVEGNTIIVYP